MSQEEFACIAELISYGQLRTWHKALAGGTLQDSRLLGAGGLVLSCNPGECWALGVQ